MFVGTSYKESSSFIRETLEETLFPPYMVMCLGGVWSAINHSGMRKPGRNEINARRREKSKGGASGERLFRASNKRTEISPSTSMYCGAVHQRVKTRKLLLNGGDRK